MNTQALGALSSDQKIENVFYALGHSVPVAKDGRRMWPTKFKREMARQMNSGKLTIDDVRKGCHVSDKTAYKWRQEFGGGKKRSLRNKPSHKEFSEIKVINDQPNIPISDTKIILKHRNVELQLPPNFSVQHLAQLILSIEGKS